MADYKYLQRFLRYGNIITVLSHARQINFFKEICIRFSFTYFQFYISFPYAQKLSEF